SYIGESGRVQVLRVRGTTGSHRWPREAYCGFSSSSVINTNQALPSLQSPAMVKDSPLLNGLTVLFTGLPSPISFTSTLGPSNSVISIMHLSLISSLPAPREGTTAVLRFTSK